MFMVWFMYQCKSCIVFSIIYTQIPTLTCTHPLFHVHSSHLVSVGCAADEFLCDTGRCIPISQKCNGRHDCTDGSDEINCCMYLSYVVFCLKNVSSLNSMSTVLLCVIASTIIVCCVHQHNAT